MTHHLPDLPYAKDALEPHMSRETLDYHHTFVPLPLRGRGIASALTAYALRHAHHENLKVVPSCPFVAAFVRRHPEHAPVIRRP